MERAANAHTLARRRHRQRRYGSHLPTPEIAIGSKHVTHDGAFLFRHELELMGCGLEVPGGDDDVDLFAPVAALARERFRTSARMAPRSPGTAGRMIMATG